MARKIQLTYKGETAYPRTITTAIVDPRTSMRLPAVLSELDRKAGGWSIEKDEVLENTFNLLDAGGVCKGSITIPKVSALKAGLYDPDKRGIVLTFDEDSGIEPILIDMNAFVTSQTVGDGLQTGEDGKLRIRVAENGHLKVVDGALSLDTDGIVFCEDTNI